MNKTWRWDVISEIVHKNNLKIGAELGVWEGHTFKNLINNCKDLFLIGVDLYEIQPNNNSEKYTPGENGNAWDHEKYYKDLTDFCEKHNDRTKFIKDTTANAALLIDDNSLDFIFIDADHSFEGANSDIKNWMPKVKENGFIIGHDIHHEPVRRAVENNFKKYEKDVDLVWYVIKNKEYIKEN